MSTCPSLDQLSDYLSNALANIDRGDLERHIAGCPRCQRTIEGLRGARPVAHRDVAVAKAPQALDGTMDDLPVTLPDSPGAATDPSSPPNLTLPGYEVLEELGRGGMGVVYRARQVSLNRLVALKMIRSASLADAKQLARFNLEAESLAQLQHPNIVQVFETGQHQDMPYLSMEYVPGVTLASEMEARTFSPQHTAALVEKLARAMFSAHGRGILHRDLKPSNVLLAADGEPKITDFGMAKRVGSESHLTVDHTVMGTPSYMPPEQAQGRLAAIGPRSDVYALGAILYEMLTGRPPFRGTTPLETIQQVIQREPVAPRSLNARIPRDLETICLKCLSKQPANRYETAADLADDLRRLQRDEPILARRIGRLGRGWRWCRRNPALSATMALTCLAMLAGTAGVAWQSRQAHRARSLAQQQFRRYKAESSEKLSLIQDLMERVPEDQRAQDQRLQSAVAAYESWLAEEPSDAAAQTSYAEALFRVAEIRRRIGQFDRAAEMYLKARLRYQQLAAASPADPTSLQKLAETLTGLGESYRDGGQLQEAIEAYDESLEYHAKFATRSQPDAFQDADTARALYSRALALRLLNRTAEAEQDLRQSIELLERSLSALPQEAAFRQGLARSRINLGILLRATARPNDAHREYLAAIDLLTGLEQQHPQNADYRLELATALMNRANLLLTDHPRNELRIEDALSQAKANYRTAIDKLGTLVSQYSNVPRYRKELANSLNGLGAVLSQLGETDEAKRSWLDAVEAIKQLVTRSPDVAEYYFLLAQTTHNLAYLQRDNPDTTEVEMLLRQAVEAQNRAIALSPTNVLYARTMRNYERTLSRVLVDRGKHVDAAEVAQHLAAHAADDAQLLYAAAKVLAKCAIVAEQDSSLSANRRSRLIDRYRLKVTELLTVCRQKGLAITPEDFPGVTVETVGSSGENNNTPPR